MIHDNRKFAKRAFHRLSEFTRQADMLACQLAVITTRNSQRVLFVDFVSQNTSRIIGTE
jgi:hypothetical protein